MFECFGWRDAIFGLLKHKFFILVICSLGLISGAVYNLYYENNESIAIENQCSSKTYYFKYINENINLGNNNTPASVMNTIVGADFCDEYVTKVVLNNYSKEELIQLLNLGISAEKFDTHQIKKAFVHQVTSDNQCLNIFATTSSSDLSQTILEAYDEYINYVVNEQLVDFEIVELGGVNQTIVESNEAPSRGLIKTLGIFGLFAFGLSVSVVFVYTMFFPTINRKSDFEKYGIQVLGEIEVKQR